MHYSGLTGTNSVQQVLPLGASWRLLFAHAVYTSSGDVGDRWLALGLLNPAGTLIANWIAGSKIAASATAQHVDFVPGVLRESAFVDGSLMTGFPAGLLVPQTYIVKVYDSAGITTNDSMTLSLGFAAETP